MSKRKPEKKTAASRSTPSPSRRASHRPWTPEEDATLERVTRCGASRRLRVDWPAVLAALPGRTRLAVLYRRDHLGLGAAGRRWTPREDKLLRDRWGEDVGRTLARKLRRTETSIYQRAQRLGLPPQMQGRASVARACAKLGVWHDTLYRLLAECGMRPQRAALVRQHPREAKRYRLLAVDPDAAEALLAVRDRRTLRLSEWAERAGVCSVSVLHRLRKAGLVPAAGGHVRYPVALLDEVDRARGRAVASGPWVDLWRAVLSLAGLPCAPWAAALAARDVAAGDVAWTEHLPQAVAAVAGRLARSVPSARRAA